MFLMYAGHHDIVKGDRRLCRFTARAPGRSKVSAAKAEYLVGAAAKRLSCRPAFWTTRYGNSAQMADASNDAAHS